MAIPVLICDDSKFAQKQMARSIPAAWDVQISFANNGQEGIAAIKEGKGDIVFLDLNMPVMDGYEVLETICKQDLPAMVIVVSGDIQPEAYTRVKSMGAVDFIKKPTDKQKLLDLLLNYGILTEEDLQVQPSAEPKQVPTKQQAIENIQQYVATKPQPKLNVTVAELDSYREVANVAMGRAADMLARLLNCFIQLPIPNVNLLEVSELHMALEAAQDTNTISAVCQGYIGSGIAGEALLLFHDSSYEDMAKLMKHTGELNKTAELELLMDTANILIGAFLTGFANQLDMSFFQGQPVVLGQHCDIVDLIKDNNEKWMRTLAIEINYHVQDFDVQCDLLLLFTEDSIRTLNSKLDYLISEYEK